MHPIRYLNPSGNFVPRVQGNSFPVPIRRPIFLRYANAEGIQSASRGGGVPTCEGKIGFAVDNLIYAVAEEVDVSVVVVAFNTGV